MGDHIEAGAVAIWGARLDNLSDEDTARACWAAMAPKWVEGLTDEQWELAWTESLDAVVRDENGPDGYHCTFSVAKIRAALLELTEVGDD